ncbi:MAG: patatin-like phospholipase family protein [Anaerolineales bacterium]|nr:patatin-like phospholipase family protein [Anaerolineales bacterium]
MKTILSIDGGGIRGIIPLACLVKLEAREGRKCRQFFDMVAGTSTGAVIAAGLALGISARGLLALYRNLAVDAFQKLPWWQVLANLGNHRYRNTFVARTLDVLGADRTLNSLPLDVLITAKNTTTGRTDFFVRDNSGNEQLWGTLSLKDAVLASIAAPTYFPPHSAEVLGESYTWVDGGVSVSGNPSYHAAVEALHFSNGEYQPGNISMFSFGTGRSPHPIDAQEASFLTWARWTLSELMDDASEWQTAVTRREYERSGRIEFRRYQVDLAHDVFQQLGVELPAGREPKDIRLDAVWAVDTLEAIGRAFADRIDFDAPGGLHLRTEQGW